MNTLLPLTLLLALLPGAGFSQDSKSPEEKARPLKFQVPPSWDVTCEVFSLPLSEAAELKRARMTNAEDYAELVKRTDVKKARQEEFLMTRVVDGQGTTLEEITEVIYATEYEPPELPNEIGPLPDDLDKVKALITPATPSAFDTKNVGSTFEVEVQSGDQESIDLSMTLTLVNYLGRNTWGQGPSEAEMPRFTVQRLASSLELKAGSPTLVGSLSPPAALQPEDGERRVWLAYVTISKAKE